MNYKEKSADLEQRVKRLEAINTDDTKMEERDKLTKEISLIFPELRAMREAEEEIRSVREAEARSPGPEGDIQVSGWAGVRAQMLGAIQSGKRSNIDISGVERRANVQVLSGGAGSNTVPGLVRALIDGGKLRSKVSVFLGKNAITTVPVFSPNPAIPVGSVPGAIATAADSTALLAGTALTLKPWYCILQVSMGALLSSDVGAEMGSIFSDAYGAAIDKMICVGAGSGSDGLGVFIASASGVPTTSDISLPTGSVAAGAVFSDYVGMVLALLALGGDPASLCVIVNPTIMQMALNATGTGADPMKQEFLRSQTVLGVPFIMSSYALTTLTNGSYIAVGGYFKHYGLAIAQEITVDQIKTVGTDAVTFQAFMYMQGNPLLGGSFRRLKTVT